MNICIPITEDKGLESPVSAHFGSAPFFLIVETDKGTTRVLANNNGHHAHGMCQPLQALAGTDVDGVVVGGIGAGALTKLLSANIRVYRSEFTTAAATVEAFKAGKLRPVTLEGACGHHGGCGNRPGGRSW